MTDKIQDAFNEAAAHAHGFLNVQQMLDSIPVDKRLPANAHRQDQINHALAYHSGFKNVQDMVDAAGMKGKKYFDA